MLKFSPTRVLISALLILAVGITAVTFFARYLRSHRDSHSWAGYVWNTASGANQVSAIWSVPALRCNVTPNAFSTAWVGVGGFGSGSTWPFPQAGTDSNCVDGKQVNDYWCSYNTFKRFSVQPGDLILSEIDKSNGSWRCSVADLTSRSSDSKTLDYDYEGETGTADWIVESTTVQVHGNAKIGKLADFGEMTFRKMRMSPGTWKMGSQYSNLSLVDSRGKVIAYPEWRRQKMTIVYGNSGST